MTMRIIKILLVLILLGGVFGGAGYLVYRLYFEDRIAMERERAKEPVEATPTPDPSVPVLEKATAAHRERDYDEAIRLYTSVIRDFPRSSVRDEAYRQLGRLNMNRLMSNEPGPNKEEYVIVKGDSLARISSRHKTPAELIIRVNQIEDVRRIQPGQRLYIPQLDLYLQIARDTQYLYVFNNDEFLIRYPIKRMELSAIREPIKAQVSAKMAWWENTPVPYESDSFINSIRWLRLSTRQLIIYSLLDDEEEQKKHAPPATGVGLDPADMNELYDLIPVRTPVTILEEI